MKNYAGMLLVATTLLAGCSGGGSSSSGSGFIPSATTSIATPSPALSMATPTPAPTSLPTPFPLTENSGTPRSGALQSFADGDTSTGGGGSTIQGVTCASYMSNNYHIHTHLSIFSGNSQVYVPQAIGLVQPSERYGMFPNSFIDIGTEDGSCAYDLHTHDYSGIVHVEAAKAPNQPYTLKQFFAIWGQTLSTTQVGSLSGNVHIYIGAAPDGAGPTGAPVEWTGSFDSIPLVERQEITIVVGTSTAPLPQYTWPNNL